MRLQREALQPAPEDKHGKQPPQKGGLTRRQFLVGLGITLGGAAAGGIAADIIAHYKPNLFGINNPNQAPTPTVKKPPIESDPTAEPTAATPEGTPHLEQKLQQLLAGKIQIPDAKRFLVYPTTTPARIGATSDEFSLDPHVAGAEAQAYFVGWRPMPDANTPTDPTQQHTVPFFGFQDVSGKWFALYFDAGRPNDFFEVDTEPDRSGDDRKRIPQAATVAQVGPLLDQQTAQCVKFFFSLVPPRSAFIHHDQQAVIEKQIPLAQKVYTFFWHVTHETPLAQMEVPEAVKPFLLTNPNAITLPTVVQSGAVPVADNLLSAPPVK